MARTPVEIGQAFHKADSPLVVWTVDSFNEFTEPMHARLIRLDDPTTYITVSIDVLSDPRYWSVVDLFRSQWSTDGSRVGGQAGETKAVWRWIKRRI